MLQHLPFVLFLCVRWGVHAREWVIGSKDNLQESVPSFPMGPSNQTQVGLNSRQLLHAGREQQALDTAYFSKWAIISKIKSSTAFIVVYFHFLTVIFLDVNIAFWDRSYWKKISFLPIDAWYSFSWRRALISSQTPSSPLFNY